MYLLFSPFSFLFFSIYLFILVRLRSVSDFLYFWLLIEFLMLLFIGISYTVFTNKVSSLIVYFFIQSLSSFLLLISYFLRRPELLSFSFFLKLGIFPFISWYISSLNSFPSSLFFIASTFQKLPPVFMLLNTRVALSMQIFWLSAILSLFLGGVIMLSSNSIRFLLVASRVGNNGWLLLASQSRIFSLFSFIIIYFLLVFFTLITLKQFSEVTSPSKAPSISTCLLYLCSLSGVPPSPLFVGKILVVISILRHSLLTWQLLAFLVLRVISSSSYVCYRMRYYVRQYRV